MKKVESKIKGELQRIRRQIAQGDNSEIFVWVIPNKLACAQRPLRDDPKLGGRNPLPPEAKPLVIEWVKRIKQMGFKSIICFLEDRQLDRYYVRGGLGLSDTGLLGYYKSQGFQVRHLSLTDYQRPSQSKMEEVLRAYDGLPKPILLHCSAGIDRTTPVAGYICLHRARDVP